MEQESVHETSNGDMKESEGQLSALHDNRIPRETFCEFCLLPKNCLLIVAGYISDERRHPENCALLGELPIILGLSQRTQLELGSFWHFGCLSLEDRWESSMKVRVKKQCLINGYQECLDFLRRGNSLSPYTAIEVLVFQLDVLSQDFSSTLFDLECIPTVLKEHLRSVQYVVFAIDKYFFFYFSLKDVINKTTGLRQTVDRPLALKQIVSDLRACWKTNQKPSTRLLLDYYIFNDVKPESDKYLSKFVISLSHCHYQDLFEDVDPTLKSSKLMWIRCWKTLDDLENISLKTTRPCQAIHFNASELSSRMDIIESLKPAFCLKDNPLVERIVICSDLLDLQVQLPRPSTLLTDTTLRSALIELTLNGIGNTLDLAHLNNGYFQNLRHLSVRGGTIKGHLDSRFVPHLQTLVLVPDSRQPQYHDSFGPEIVKNTQSLILSGHPWQLVASVASGGWALASYDEATTNPQEDVKEDSPHSPPLAPHIRELMLVMSHQVHANEWQSRLNGNLPLQPAAGDESSRLLVWAPERVQKITVYGTMGKTSSLEFRENIPGRTRILTSLSCRGISLAVNGAVLPHLESLEVILSDMALSGAFRQLKMMFFASIYLTESWGMNAPLLESFNCLHVKNGHELYMRSDWLPHLSYLRIELCDRDFGHCPIPIADDDGLGFSRVQRIELETGMAKSPLFDQWQFINALHLELAADDWGLPACWENTEWRCETLTVYFDMIYPNGVPICEVTPIKSPSLLPCVKTLTVETQGYPVLIDSEMFELTDLTVPSPISLGPNLWCPSLTHICFTDELSESDINKCLDRATYEAIGARPRWVYFRDSGGAKRMLWAIAPSAIGESSDEGSMDDAD